VDFVAAGPSQAPSTARIEKPSWFGESVGRYENGELVIDTIGLAEHPYGVVDNWHTSHTKDLPVAERWKIVDAASAIEATATFD
jgi:hypothetical protein